jgi:hypothetical protein
MDLSRASPRPHKNTSRQETIGSLAELQIKSPAHQTAAEYHSIDHEADRSENVHLQVTFQRKNSPNPSMFGTILDKDTGFLKYFFGPFSVYT